jgi:hypothetical protein
VCRSNIVIKCDKKRKKPRRRRLSQLPKEEQEILELRNFVTVFKDGTEIYETKMAAARHASVKGAPSGGIELELREFLFR